MKIAHKLILSFLIFSLLIWLICYLAFQKSQDVVKIFIGKNSANYAVEVLNAIEKNFESKIEVFDVYTNAMHLQEFLLQSNREFKQNNNLQNYLNNMDRQWVKNSSETINSFIHNMQQNELSKELVKIISYYEKKYGRKIYGKVFITNKYGANVAMTAKTSDYRQDDEVWWQKTKKRGIHFSGIQYDISADVYSLDISLKISDMENNFIGIIKIVMNADEVISLLKRITKDSVYKSTSARIINKDVVIYSTDEHSSDHELLLGIFQEKVNNKYGYFEEKIKNHHALYAYAISNKNNMFKMLGWYLIIEQELEEVYAPVYRLKKYILLIPLVFTILAGLLGIYISRSISLPLKELSLSAIEIGKGKLDTEIRIQSTDEIGKLAVSLKKMAQEIKSSTTSIENLNRE